MAKSQRFTDFSKAKRSCPFLKILIYDHITDLSQ